MTLNVWPEIELDARNTTFCVKAPNSIRGNYEWVKTPAGVHPLFQFFRRPEGARCLVPLLRLLRLHAETSVAAGGLGEECTLGRKLHF